MVCGEGRYSILLTVSLYTYYVECKDISCFVRAARLRRRSVIATHVAGCVRAPCSCNVIQQRHAPTTLIARFHSAPHLLKT